MAKSAVFDLHGSVRPVAQGHASFFSCGASITACFSSCIDRLKRCSAGSAGRLPDLPWTALSWVSTISLVNLGWIFFRANSLHQARQMLTAILSPATYRVRFLTGSLYLLVLALAVGYTVVLLEIDSLNRVSTEAVDAEAPQVDLPTGPMALLARWRWFWLPPLYVLALIFVLIVTLSRGPSTAQMMYGNF